MNCRIAWRKLVAASRGCRWLSVVVALSMLCFEALSQPYGLENRPAVGAFLNGQVPADPSAAFPLLLSQTGAFADVATLTPASGLIPFDVNAALWTDGAWKVRWIAVPDGAQVQYSQAGSWTFPAGTVLVKHFELGINDTNPNIRKRIETRLLVVASNASVFGVTYRWRADNSDADRLSSGLSENITVQTATGTRKQRWSYPSTYECMTCHNLPSGFVLGPKTSQLNRDIHYGMTGVTDNQLRTWIHVGLLANPPSEASIATLPRMSSLSETTASLEDRARSYLDSNCAHCHQPGGPAHASFDARYLTPLSQQGLINARVAQSLDVWGARLIAPGDAERSMILSRLFRLDSYKMPPLGRNATDTQAVEVVRAWINGMSRDGGPYRLVGSGAEWKFHDDGSSPEAGWQGVAFDDAGWFSGASELGFGDDDEMTVVGAGAFPATVYFRRAFTVANVSLYTNLQLRLLRDDGAAVYLNGTELLRNNLPLGPLSHGTPALTDVDGDDEVNFIEMSIPPGRLVEGTNVFAVEVHQSGALSDDLSFDLELLGWVRPASMLVPPQLEVVPADSEGTVRLRLFGFDAQPYLIESSNDLNQWIPRWTNAPSGGVRDFSEPRNAMPSQFYRARLWP